MLDAEVPTGAVLDGTAAEWAGPERAAVGLGVPFEPAHDPGTPAPRQPVGSGFPAEVATDPAVVPGLSIARRDVGGGAVGAPSRPPTTLAMGFGTCAAASPVEAPASESAAPKPITATRRLFR